MNKLADYRQQIEAIDLELVALLEKRSELAIKLGPEKRRLGLAKRIPEREQELLAKLSANCRLLRIEELESIYQQIFDLSIRIQESTKIVP